MAKYGQAKALKVAGAAAAVDLGAFGSIGKRAGQLLKLLAELDRGGPEVRVLPEVLARRLCVSLRSFYRDLAELRQAGIVSGMRRCRVGSLVRVNWAVVAPVLQKALTLRELCAMRRGRWSRRFEAASAALQAMVAAGFGSCHVGAMFMDQERITEETGPEVGSLADRMARLGLKVNG